MNLSTADNMGRLSFMVFHIVTCCLLCHLAGASWRANDETWSWVGIHAANHVPMMHVRGQSQPVSGIFNHI